MNSVKDSLQKLLNSGLSQMEISRRSGMSQTRVHRWARGGIPASADHGVMLVEMAASLASSADQSASASAEKNEGASS